MAPVLAFLTNIGLPELTVVAGLAVIIFGKRLPEVAAKAYGQVLKLRRTIDRLRRETGLDKELRDIEYTVRDAARKAALEKPLPPPAEFRARHNQGSRGPAAVPAPEATEQGKPGAADVEPPPGGETLAAPKAPEARETPGQEPPAAPEDPETTDDSAPKAES